MTREIELRVRRGTPEEPGGLRSFKVAADEKTTILDALEKIRGSRGASGGAPLYRHSCHHGSCGTCGCIVNGVEKLACVTRLLELGSDTVTVEPLKSAVLLKDLAVFPGPLFEGLPLEAAYRRKSETDPECVRFEDCIECGSCVSACPVRPPFLGPAALAAYSREIENRPERKREILEKTGGKNGAAACERNIFCSLVCPTKVAPAKHIMTLKTLSAKRERPTP